MCTLRVRDLASCTASCDPCARACERAAAPAHERAGAGERAGARRIARSKGRAESTARDRAGAGRGWAGPAPAAAAQTGRSWQRPRWTGSSPAPTRTGTQTDTGRHRQRCTDTQTQILTVRDSDDSNAAAVPDSRPAAANATCPAWQARPATPITDTARPALRARTVVWFRAGPAILLRVGPALSDAGWAHPEGLPHVRSLHHHQPQPHRPLLPPPVPSQAQITTDTPRRRLCCRPPCSAHFPAAPAGGAARPLSKRGTAGFAASPPKPAATFSPQPGASRGWSQARSGDGQGGAGGAGRGYRAGDVRVGEAVPRLSVIFALRLRLQDTGQRSPPPARRVSWRSRP